MLTITSVEAMRRHRRGMSGRVALIPTMGALHEGHLAHVAPARRAADHVVLSIFVNPTQFGPREDFDQYPRALKDDLRACEAAGVDCVFAPTVDQMYPPDAADVVVDVPALSGGLEGEARPGHFTGVCRVVAKLLNIVRPDAATFGRKDYQQLRVVAAMVGGLAMPVKILEAPTVREPDGLARSSRNRRLTREQRGHALGLFKALRQAKRMVEQEGETDPARVEQAMVRTLVSHHVEVDYAAMRHPQTLAALDCLEPGLGGGVVALVAGRVGEVRLIDNMLLGASTESA